jgi:antitoxin component YwqK of YwqJK toxin-antitoxin module
MQLIRYKIILVLCCFVCSCKPKAKKIDAVKTPVKLVANVFVDKDSLQLNQLNGNWLLNQKPFSGVAIAYYSDGTISEKTNFESGKRQGSAVKYFEDGSIKIQSYYQSNKLEGTKTAFFPNGKIYAISNYKEGKRNGVQKTFYITGQLAKKQQMKNGLENGMQQAWLENGKLYVNYQAKNGRIFGLNRANLCYKLKNEKVQYANKE